MLLLAPFGRSAATRYSFRSDSGILLSKPNFKTSTTLAERNFVASAPKPRNSLPFKIRMATSVDHFKKRFKTYFLARLFLSKISAL